MILKWFNLMISITLNVKIDSGQRSSCLYLKIHILSLKLTYQKGAKIDDVMG